MNARLYLASLMDASVHNAANWHYRMSRPFTNHPTVEQITHGSIVADCSAGFTILCELAGIPDPSGYSYDGYGNSESIWQHLPHVTIDKLDIGDAVIFGEGGSHHISMVRQPGPDPIVWSNGSEAAPAYYRLSQERGWQPPAVTYAKIDAPPSVPPHPTVDDYWEWLRWSLGEGEFKGHKMDPALRPHGLPKRIPKAWWNRREAFVKARKKPGHGTSVPKATP